MKTTPTDEYHKTFAHLRCLWSEAFGVMSITEPSSVNGRLIAFATLVVLDTKGMPAMRPMTAEELEYGKDP